MRDYETLKKEFARVQAEMNEYKKAKLDLLSNEIRNNSEIQEYLFDKSDEDIVSFSNQFPVIFERFLKSEKKKKFSQKETQ